MRTPGRALLRSGTLGMGGSAPIGAVAVASATTPERATASTTPCMEVTPSIVLTTREAEQSADTRRGRCGDLLTPHLGRNRGARPRGGAARQAVVPLVCQGLNRVLHQRDRSSTAHSRVVARCWRRLDASEPRALAASFSVGYEHSWAPSRLVADDCWNHTTK